MPSEGLHPTPPKVDLTTSVLEALTSGEKYYPAHTAGPKLTGEAIPDLLSTSSVYYHPGSSGHVDTPATKVEVLPHFMPHGEHPHMVSVPHVVVPHEHEGSHPYPPAIKMVTYPYPPAVKMVTYPYPPATTPKPTPKVTFPYPPATKKVTYPYPPATTPKPVVTYPYPPAVKTAPYPPAVKTGPYPAALH